LANKIVSHYSIFFSKIVYLYRFNRYIFLYRCPPLLASIPLHVAGTHAVAAVFSAVGPTIHNLRPCSCPFPMSMLPAPMLLQVFLLLLAQLLVLSLHHDVAA
jgi:hypothetical protein